MRYLFYLTVCSILWVPVAAQTPDNLVVEGIPTFPPELIERLQPYFETRVAQLESWHPVKREILITTRFGDTAQLHQVKMPGGVRKQLTFFADRVSGGSFRPQNGDIIVFSKDVGGGEFFQFYRYDMDDGGIATLTDGKSRNTNATWSKSGKWLAFSSTRRSGKDTDLYVMNPEDPSTTRMVLQVEGGGWSVSDWSKDDSSLIAVEYVSAHESSLYLYGCGDRQEEIVDAEK
jgi:tricorn protease-like protein